MARRSAQRHDHVSGRYRRDAPPPDRRGAPGDRVRRPGLLLIGGLIGGITAAALTTLIALAILLRPPVVVGQNAIWLGIDWGSSAQTEDVVGALAEQFRDNGMGTAYVWTSWLQEDDTWSETTFEHLPAFVAQLKQAFPGLSLQAWIGLPAEVPEYRLDDAELRAEVAAFSQRAVTEFGFDGVHLNVEPVWDGDENFLALLREVRQALGPEVPLSAAVPPDWNTGTPGIPVGPYTTTDAMWSETYKRQVGFLVDEVVVMAYNSGLASPLDYQVWMAFQVQQFASALATLETGTVLIIGIPTYDAELPGHDPAVESVQAAVTGIRQGMQAAGEAASLVRGVGIYAYWSTDTTEWAAYRQLWLSPAE